MDDVPLDKDLIRAFDTMGSVMNDRHLKAFERYKLAVNMANIHGPIDRRRYWAVEADERRQVLIDMMFF